MEHEDLAMAVGGPFDGQLVPKPLFGLDQKRTTVATDEEGGTLGVTTRPGAIVEGHAYVYHSDVNQWIYDGATTNALTNITKEQNGSG